ncbi:class I SAM-dependent methyltransferase [Paucibacter sp. KBW04]|uniref:class I SAM-dependent methyltransferase n=1 Tax=Paucibacter sp. KBW04 TaxID=2153361 RepID=UPI000F5894AC|nr:class I SAM-dependent methyltransferase [Paucibacter sp. KBW04]RQO60006.1 class I SAM-dependent methyltransferase [Paucibacter sp. KBW04]
MTLTTQDDACSLQDFSSLSEAELRALDTSLQAQDSPRWDAFYQDRAKPIPFFGEQPDESLAAWLDDGHFPVNRGRALDLGCGNARNAIHLARSGFQVEALDYSAQAIAWARERVAASGTEVTLRQGDFFELALPEGAYDLVYDSGCFHHIAPHRRAGYVARVLRALKPGGHFGLCSFRPEGGSGFSDAEVYARHSLGGGLGYSEAQLRALWSPALQLRELRQMRKPAADSGRFGETFLWVMLGQKQA